MYSTYLRYFFSFFGGSLVLFYLAVLAQIGVPTMSSERTFLIVKSKETLQPSRSGKKILLVGGSGTHFSLKCVEISRLLNIPCLNVASHAALPLDFHLEIASKIANQGDIVILSPEYEYYGAQPFLNDGYADYLYSRDQSRLWSLGLFGSLRALGACSWTRLLYGHRSRFGLVDNRLQDSGYSIENQNEFGDVKTIVESKSFVKTLRCTLPEYSQSFQSSLEKSIQKHFSGKKAQFIAKWPALLRDGKNEEADYSRFFTKVVSAYKKLGIITIGKPKDYMFPREQFWDSCYHQTTEASLEHTRKFVHELTSAVSIRELSGL